MDLVETERLHDLLSELFSLSRSPTVCVRRPKEQSRPVHLGLATSLFFLYLLFFFTGTLANVGGEGLCRWVGAGLHYALLSSLTWMAVEVFHTFWLVYVVFSPSPKPWVWNLIGFGEYVFHVVIK